MPNENVIQLINREFQTMNLFQYDFFVTIAPITALAVIGVISFAQLRFPSKETRSLTWLMLTASGWLALNTLELVASSPEATLFFAKATYIFVGLTPVAWFVFALRYSGQERWLNPHNVFLLLVIPAAFVLLTWTNDFHRLIWYEVRFIPVGKMLAISVKHGPLFWVGAGYCYLLAFGGSALLLIHFFRNDLYRTQSYWLVAGALIPLAANVSHLFHLIPGLTKDYTPVSFGLGILAFAAGMLRYRLFDLLPVTREVMIDSMGDAMFTMDAQDRISDCNRAGERLLGTARRALLGQPVESVFAAWTKLADTLRDPDSEHCEFSHTGRDGVIYYDIQVLPLLGRNNQQAGRLLVLRDITSLRHAEEVLQRSNQELRTSNRFLDAYAQILARDLKHPLLTIRASANLLKTRHHEIQTGTADYLIDNITDNSQKIISQLDELLLLSSVRRADVSFTTLDMKKLVENALQRIPANGAFQKDKISMPVSWPLAFGKPAWIEEIWVNYFNVFAQSGAQGIVLELGASKGNASKKARFWVQNIGMPLPIEERTQLLHTFDELESIQLSEFGLGLSIVRRIVIRLGGEMGMDGDVNTRLWFSIPAQVEQPVKDSIIDERILA
jgi:PAS domain S-box-containing protein